MHFAMFTIFGINLRFDNFCGVNRERRVEAAGGEWQRDRGGPGRYVQERHDNGPPPRERGQPKHAVLHVL